LLDPKLADPGSTLLHTALRFKVVMLIYEILCNTCFFL